MQQPLPADSFRSLQFIIHNHRMRMKHQHMPAVFSYGTDNPALNGNFYSRQYTGSSLLYDEIDGAYQVVEMTDRSPISTRVVNQ